jgi:epoxyqueuosine reductase
VSQPKNNAEFIKAKAHELGFQSCGIAKAEFLEDVAPQLEEWLRTNQHGKMAYMANHFDKRLDPTLLVPGAKSVISLAFNYFPSKDIMHNGSYKLAKYAYGEDYHFVIKDKLKELFSEIEKEVGTIEGRVFVDSAPVMERQWAARSGLGWLGKNSLLLNKQKGSFFFLAEVILNLELEYDSPVTNHCGTCTKCIDACPTEAISKEGVVNASHCISYFTIELKEELPTSVKGKFEDWIFGCDICQDVCPWNRFSIAHSEPRFEPHPALEQMTKSDWQELTEEVFGNLFKKSAVKRTKYAGLMRNIRFLNK